jgi:mannose-6-phosphate isomerase
MRFIVRLENPIQSYAWGSHTAIVRLLRRGERSEEPQAEMWMGAHPKAPSHLLLSEGETSLLSVMQRFSTEILGWEADEHFEGELPFLFKVLAAEKPLSIQAHPNRAQAQAGFAREEALGIPRGAWERSYRDANHKPELICALTPFWALRGFRPAAEIAGWLEHLQVDALSSIRKLLTLPDEEEALRHFYAAFLQLPASAHEGVIRQILKGAQALCEESGEAGEMGRWILRLAEEYPREIAILSPAILNLIRLEPGEAMFLPDGELHAYLEGTGIEIMANSDNVLRGGLTVKHIDIPELLSILRFTPTVIQRLHAMPCSDGIEAIYPTEVEEFALSVLNLASDRAYQSAAKRSVEILLCVEGAASLQSARMQPLSLQQGDALLIPAAASAYTLSGKARVYKATVGHLQTQRKV